MTDAADLRAVDSADVYVNDTLTATLARDRRDMVSLKYVSPSPTGRAASIAWTLPGSANTYRTTGGNVPAFLAGLLPEGVRLGVVVAAAKTSVDDQFTLLLAIGADTVGNVRVTPAGATPQSLSPMFDPDDVNDLRAVFTTLSTSFRADPIGLAGVQPKVSSAMWSTPATTHSGAAILKLAPPERFPQIIENEHFFMTMASALGIRTASNRLVTDSQGTTGLLVERFDRVGATRIAQEDACQVMGIYPASKYRVKTESVLADLSDTCERGGGSRVAALLELFKVVAFSWLIGNGDLHGKNMSVYAPAGTWQPTPAYDLLCTQPYLGWRDPMALNFYGRDGRLTRRHFVQSGERLGLRPRAVERVLDALVDAAPRHIDRCIEIGFDERTTERLTTFLRDRLTTLT